MMKYNKNHTKTKNFIILSFTLLMILLIYNILLQQESKKQIQIRFYFLLENIEKYKILHSEFPKDLMTTIKEDTRTGKTPRVLKSTIGGSVQVGTVVGVTKPEEVDKAIEGRSLGVQGCHFGCLGISKGEGKNGAVIVTTGVGTTQIGVNGSVMRQLTDKEKKTLQDLGILR
ncbi:hypothetical protein [Moraxella catarrhalis]|uniref:hypothetical protein n=2 Tax=Moraxella catarrhalis TaxID=480 RepID=UPI000AD225BC|nr:hypothetical protein [Moraxella catarrhalis]